MGTDANGDWDGVCACGKKELDGIECFLGATHQTLEMARAADRERNPHLYPTPPAFPWATSSDPATAPSPAPLFPWTSFKLPWE